MDMQMTSTKTAMEMATTLISSATGSATSAASAVNMSGHAGGMGGGMVGGMGGGMGHGMPMGGCKISMLWNWNVEDTCFISKSWHVTSKGMFAGSCLGTVCLVISLELLRRSVKEYDRFLIKQHAAGFQQDKGLPVSRSSSTKFMAASSSGDGDDQDQQQQQQQQGAAPRNGPLATADASSAIPPFRPTAAQQAIRALLHTMQFAVAYFIMLLAMYYNGYIIICIFIGAYLGSFIFHWEPLSPGQTSAAKEATVCCA
ncbi:Copper transport protein ctr4 [Escovopsis weberi]|uniref:Copper transport protein n=1 Tax=Escovopsis weberi TaxID=150374 RepID=A0A0M9VSI5_ESCWE|nr:Copper transport protein ctr4 [Escovopsis weberi]